MHDRRPYTVFIFAFTFWLTDDGLSCYCCYYCCFLRYAVVFAAQKSMHIHEHRIAITRMLSKILHLFGHWTNDARCSEVVFAIRRLSIFYVAGCLGTRKMAAIKQALVNMCEKHLNSNNISIPFNKITRKYFLTTWYQPIFV